MIPCPSCGTLHVLDPENRRGGLCSRCISSDDGFNRLKEQVKKSYYAVLADINDKADQEIAKQDATRVKCTCWLGTDSTFGSSDDRATCMVHSESRLQHVYDTIRKLDIALAAQQATEPEHVSRYTLTFKRGIETVGMIRGLPSTALVSDRQRVIETEQLLERLTGLRVHIQEGE